MTELISATIQSDEKARIILVSMVKNESRIIQRLMGSVESWIDGYCIVDTGSTDNTVVLAKEFIQKSGKPGVVRTISWVNFGVSRTASVKEAVDWVASLEGWNPKYTWGLLLDGDMILKDPVNKIELANTIYDSISLKQKTGNLIYDNTRLLRLNHFWTCTGATHEYWDTGENRTYWSTPIIQDLNDGGCKSDKLTRDAKLLEDELQKNPNHDRTLFYLGQTYQGLGRHEDAIRMLRRRIEVGGWIEEVYIAHMYIGDELLAMGKFAEAIYEWMRGWQKMRNRTECAMRIIHHLRLKPDQQFVAMMFLEKLLELQTGTGLTGLPTGRPALKNDSRLFVSHRDMSHMIWEELAILAHYSGHKREAWLHIDFQSILKNHDWNVRNNFLSYQKWYDGIVPTLASNRLRLPKGTEPWKEESDSYIWQPYNPSIRLVEGGDGDFELILRHANYSTPNAKDFPYRGREGRIITRNVLCKLNADLTVNANSARELIPPPEAILQPNNHIVGFEDCRLIQGSTEPMVLATGRQFTLSGTNKISKIRITEPLEVIEMPLPAGVNPGDCQKNWLPFQWRGEPHYVFSINPFVICKFDGSRILEWKLPEGSAFTLDGFRGSAAPVPFEGDQEAWLMVVHNSHYGGDGRRYYTRFLTLDHNGHPRRLSMGVRFQKQNIEYVSGLAPTNDGNYIVTYGVNDSEAYAAKISKELLQNLLCYDLQTNQINVSSRWESACVCANQS